MEVQMVDRLAPFPPVVDDHAKSVVEAALTRDAIRDLHDAAEQTRILGPEVDECRNVASWNDQDVRRRLWVDVFDGDDLYEEYVRDLSDEAIGDWLVVIDYHS